MSTTTTDSTHSESFSKNYQNHNHSRNQSNQQESLKTINSKNQIIKSNGRPKVNTLPPWAKSHNDDEQLFKTISKPSIPIFNSPRSPQLSRSINTLHPGTELSTVSKHFTKINRSSISTATLVPDSPPLQEEWNEIKQKLKQHHHLSTTQLTAEYPSHHLDQHLLSPTIDGQFPKASSSTSNNNNNNNNDTHQNLPSNPPRRPIYRAMTSPTPVFQRFRPLITVNGQKKRNTEDNPNPTDQQDQSDLRSTHQSPLPNSSSQQPPDDRWWQFTLPTKYRRKVEEYLNRGGHGIGGVHHLNEPPSPSSTPPRMEMVEIDEDRRKIIALLKRHASPFQTRQSSQDSIDPQYDFHHQYGSIPIISPSYRLSNEDTIRLNATNSPNDFPLPAFSRKLSLTPLQQEQFLNPLGSHKNPFDESPRSMNIPSQPSFSSSTYQPTSSSLGGIASMSKHYYHENHQNKSRTSRIGFYFMHHPTAPLLCRLLNFILTASSLAICATIRKIESQSNLDGILGSSTLFILVVAPLGLFHNLFAIYCEYFGAPIGIWSVSWKMFHTLSELVFVSLWSAGLALSMNDELRSPLKCAGVNKDNDMNRRMMLMMTNNSIGNTVPIELQRKINSISGINLSTTKLQEIINNIITSNYYLEDQVNQQNKTQFIKISKLCHLQASLVSIVFAGLALYSVVLIVSLFRIFLKVSRKY